MIVVFLAMEVALDVVDAVITIGDLRSVSERNYDFESPSHLLITQLSEWVDYAYSGLILLLTVVWCIWTSRVCKNAWLINSRDGATAIYRGRKSYGAVEAWIFHFVPIVQFWIPFLAMAWIRDASQKPLGLTMGKLLELWWFFWILSFLTACFTIYLLSIARGSEEIATAYRANVVLRPVDVLSAIFAALVVVRLSKIQKVRARDLGLIPN